MALCTLFPKKKSGSRGGGTSGYVLLIGLLTVAFSSTCFSFFSAINSCVIVVFSILNVSISALTHFKSTLYVSITVVQLATIAEAKLVTLEPFLKLSSCSTRLLLV